MKHLPARRKTQAKMHQSNLKFAQAQKLQAVCFGSSLVQLKIGMGNESGRYDGTTKPPLEAANSSHQKNGGRSTSAFLKKREEVWMIVLVS